MRCSSLDTAALVVAVGATLAGCASRGPRAAEMEHVRERRACQVRPEACGPEAGLEAWAAGLRRLRVEQCGTDHALGPGAVEFVCEEPVRFVRYDFDLMPWMEADWGPRPRAPRSAPVPGGRRLRGRGQQLRGVLGAGAVLPAGSAPAAATDPAAADGRVHRLGAAIMCGVTVARSRSGFCGEILQPRPLVFEFPQVGDGDRLAGCAGRAEHVPCVVFVRSAKPSEPRRVVAGRVL